MSVLVVVLLVLPLSACSSAIAGNSKDRSKFVRETYTITVDDPVYVNVLHIYKPNVRSRGAILMIHGGWHTSFFFHLEDNSKYSLMEFLAKRRYDTFALDLRGSGLSYRGDLTWYSQISGLDYVADVAAVVTDIQARGYEKVTILAHSLGGMAATMYAAIYPTTVAGFIDIGTPFMAFGLPPEMIEQFIEAFQTYPALPFMEEMLPFFFAPGHVEEYVLDITVAILSQQFAGQTIGLELLGGLWIPYVYAIPPDIPVLLLKGSLDAIQLDSDAETFLNAFASEDKRLIILEGYGHNLLLEIHAKKPYKVIGHWLKTH